jgi:antitoxin Phd
VHAWSLQDAKARFSELVNRTLSEGAQIVSRHGKEVVAVIPVGEYRRLSRPQSTLSEFLLAAPRVTLDVDRDQSGDRDIEL